MLPLIGIACAISVVWGFIFLARGSLLLGGVIFLIVGYCFGREFLRFDIGSLPLTLERPVLAVLMAMGLFQLLSRKSPLARFTWIEYSTIALALLLTFSTFAYDWTFKSYTPIYRLVACYLMPVALYFVVRNSQFDERIVNWTLAGLTLFGLYLACTAVAEVTKQWWLVYPSYIADAKLGIHFGRARGPALQAQSLGLYLGLTGLCMWTWLGRLGPFAHFLRLLLTPLFLGAIVCTATRSPWLGTALAGFIIVMLTMSSAWRPILVTAALLSGMVAYTYKDSLLEISRGDQSRAASSDSVDHRKVYLYVSWLMFQDRPLFGCGAGQFVPESIGYLSDHEISSHLAKIKTIPHHNTFLCLLVETGVVGCGLFVAILIGWTRRAYRMWSTATIPWVRSQGQLMLAGLGFYLPDAIFFDPGSFAHQDHYFLFFLAGMTSAAATTTVPVMSVAPVIAIERQPVRNDAGNLGLST